jgi:hypothetical protein
MDGQTPGADTGFQIQTMLLRPYLIQGANGGDNQGSSHAVIPLKTSTEHNTLYVNVNSLTQSLCGSDQQAVKP